MSIGLSRIPMIPSPSPSRLAAGRYPRYAGGSLALISLALTLLLVRSAEAKPSVAGTAITKMLRGLSWGSSPDKVFESLDTELKDQYRERIRAVAGNSLKVDALRKEQTQRMQAIKDSFTRFTGQRTGYEASLIRRDFRHQNNEAVIRVDEHEAKRQRYYFFRYDRLWKLIISYPSDYTRGEFSAFVDKIKRRYGRPGKLNWDAPQGEARKLVSALWQDELSQLTAEDHTTFYGRFVMKLLSRAEGIEIEEFHAQAEQAEAPEEPAEKPAEAPVEKEGGFFA